jgi:hypothetical protein
MFAENVWGNLLKQVSSNTEEMEGGWNCLGILSVWWY